MAFEIKHKGPPRKTFWYSIRRQSDGQHWGASAGWQDAPVLNLLLEQSRGLYSIWFTTTDKDETYEVTVPSAGGLPLQSYVCDARGKPVVSQSQGKVTNVTIIKGVLHVGGLPRAPEAHYEALSSNGLTRYTAIRWQGGICTCDCPAWTVSVKHKGKALTDRTCKHTRQVATMTTSVSLSGTILPTPVAPAVGSTERTGRGIELD